MTEEEIKEYIRNKNLDIRTIEQIVSFMNDRDIRFCGNLRWYDKKDIVKFVYENRFLEIWKAVQEEMKQQMKARYNT